MLAESMKELLASAGFSSAFLGATLLDGTYSVCTGNGWIELRCFGIYANYVSVDFVGNDGSLIEYGACYNSEQLGNALKNHTQVSEIV